MKPIGVKSSTYIEFSVKNDDNNAKFKVGDNVRILKYESIFGKGFTSNQFEELLGRFMKKKSHTHKKIKQNLALKK